MNTRDDILAAVESSASIASKLTAIRSGEDGVAFEHVTEAAQPFLAAVIARKERRRTWIVCANVRVQEFIHNEITNWLPESLFFPEIETSPGASAIPDPEISAERLSVLHRLAVSRERDVIVVSLSSLDDLIPSPEGLKRLGIRIARNERINRAELLARLQRAKYERAPQVSLRGQYAVRGGILDIYSWHDAQPIRIELFDETVESIRRFDLDAQTSVRNLDTCMLLLGEMEKVEQCRLREMFRNDDLTIDSGAGFDGARVHILESSEGVDVQEDFGGAFYDHGFGDFEAGDLIVEETKRERLFRQLSEWRNNGWRVFIFCNNEGEMERIRELIPPEELQNRRLVITEGSLFNGFAFPQSRIAVLSDSELFGRYRHTRARRLALRRARAQATRQQIDFSELNEGDYVVHLEHGIARYEGLQTFGEDVLGGGKGGGAGLQEALVLEFADEARLYVPLEQSYLVSRYVGVGKKIPALSALGDTRWSRARKNAERAVFDYAAKLLSLQAERETAMGFACAQDNRWQHEFERSFLFKETPDQITSIAATKSDMESERPMDRLICGDVGFGKTEIAIRAAFKAVMNGKQVAVLVPTTVLAQQHYQTFRERMSDYPVSIEMLSRFRSAAEQKKTVAGLLDGSVDIVIGTHRLISKDIRFKELGLVVIDEEQRFGVSHKEKFKQLFKLVDVLTLSATPIPRTLYLSLMGARDMSTLETPPMNRFPVETMVCGYDERLIRDAIQRELHRQGQVYFLHNRVRSIDTMASRIRLLVPDAKVDVGHGQMDEHELEDVMQRFVEGKTDVLISTTIIESGLDIPNANTIIINRADRFGLADLYQLRGRVGRANHKAYAFLLLPREMMTVGAARKRVNAIKQYSTLGAGFKIAMRDLEIRGAGNILGTAQSGHIVNIGFDLYCQLLRQAVSRLKGEGVRPRLEVILQCDLAVTNEAKWAGRNGDLEVAPAFLPVSYIEDSQTRIQAYRKLAEVTTGQQLEALERIWRDRFGPLPDAAENLVILTAIRIAAAKRKITRVETKERKLMLTRGGDYILIAGKFPRIPGETPAETLRETLELIRNL